MTDDRLIRQRIAMSLAMWDDRYPPMASCAGIEEYYPDGSVRLWGGPYNVSCRLEIEHPFQREITERDNARREVVLNFARNAGTTITRVFMEAIETEGE